MNKMIKEMNNVVQLSEYRKKIKRKRLFWAVATRLFILSYLAVVIFLALRICGVV